MIENWTFPGEEGKPTRVDIYATDEEVELLINGVSAGRKPAGAASKNKATFDVIYQPGTIVAIGYRDGKETSRTSLQTSGAPTALRLTPDRATINCEYGDLAYVTVEIVDEHGYVVSYADPAVSFEVSGAGELIALGTANPLSEESYTSKQRKAWQGRLLAVVRSSGHPGEIMLTAHADELISSEIRLNAKA